MFSSISYIIPNTLEIPYFQFIVYKYNTKK